MMRVSWRTEAPQWLVLGAMLLAGALAWPAAPDRIPSRWSFRGEVTGYAGREILLILPLAALALYLLLLGLPRIDPGRANYAAFAAAYTVIRWSVLFFFAGAYLLILISMRGAAIDMLLIGPLGLGLLFIVLGSVLGKVRPNWFVGIRTPWTLSSKVAWTRTHRVGGWVFIGTGLAFVAAALLHAPGAFAAAIALGVAGGLLLVAYSYFVWRSDPDKVPPSGTLPAE